MEIRTSVDDGTRQVEVAVSVQHSYENDPRSAVYRAGRAEIETAHGAALEALFTQIEKYHPTPSVPPPLDAVVPVVFKDGDGSGSGGRT